MEIDSTRQTAIKSSLGVWLAGVLSTVIGGLLIWALTQSPSSPLMPTARHSIKLAGFETTPTWMKAVGTGSVQATVSLFNEGNGLARDCSVFWYSRPQVSASVFGLPITEVVGSFGIPASQGKEVKLEHFFTLGTYLMSVLVSCHGGGVSETHVGTLNVKW